jgi:excisionase family DNA binding protein
MNEWLTIREAAEILKLSEHTVRDRVREGKIPSTKLGYRTVRIRRADIESRLPSAPLALPERGLDRAGMGRWLLEVVEGQGSTEEKLSLVRAFAYGLVSE